MTLLFALQLRSSPSEADVDEVRRLLDDVVALEEAEFGRRVTLHAARPGAAVIALVTHGDGLDALSPWEVTDDHGVAWDGICEGWLTSPERDAFRALDGRGPMEWAGRWAACRWRADASVIEVVTGAWGTTALFLSSGRRGWAVGSRPAVVRRLVGEPCEIDLREAALYAAVGYPAGGGSLVAGVQRVPSRSRVRLGAGGATVELDRSLGDLLEPSLPRPGLVEVVAASVRDRIAFQLGRSSDPVLLLTGGRDSRCVAAGIHAVGGTVRARTQGTPEQTEVRIARSVAHRLGFAHESVGRGEDAASAVAPSRPAGSGRPRDGAGSAGGGSGVSGASDGRSGVSGYSAQRAARWAEVTQGLRPLQQLTPAPHPPGGDRAYQFFTGLGGEIIRAFYRPAFGRARFDVGGLEQAWASHAPFGIHLRRPYREAMHDVIAATHTEIGTVARTAEQWLDIFYWQGRCIIWSGDGLDVGDALGWRWSPLWDASIVRAILSLDEGEKRSDRFIPELTAALAPALAGLAYDVPKDPFNRALRGFGKAALATAASVQPGLTLRLVARLRPGSRRTIPMLRELLFGPGDHVWPAIVDERLVREIARAHPNAELLWNLGTIEATARAL